MFAELQLYRKLPPRHLRFLTADLIRYGATHPAPYGTVQCRAGLYHAGFGVNL